MAETANKAKTITFVKAAFRELLAIFFWTYVVLKVFVFDVDIYIANHFAAPLYYALVKFKLPILLGFVCILWIALGNKQFGLVLLYIIGYPFVVLFWKLPRLLLKNWSTAIVLTPLFFELATAFKRFFISYALIIIAATCIFASNNSLVLLMSMGTLFVLLVMHLWFSFNQAYKATAFSRISKVVSSIKTELANTTLLQKLLDNSGSNPSSSAKEKVRSSKLSTVYIFYSSVEFATEKVRDILRSRKMDMYLILSWLCTVVLTATIFSFEYFALFKIDQKAFSADFPPNFFSFLGFSVGKLMPSSISTMTPANSYANIICYMQLACALLILVILVFTILTAARERYKEDIENIVNELKEIGLLLQQGSQRIFNIALADIEQILLNDNSLLVNQMRKMRGLPELPARTADNKEVPPTSP